MRGNDPSRLSVNNNNLNTMDIYTIAKEEANIKRQKESLDRKVLVDNMRRRETKMLEAFIDLGIKYEKSSWYREQEELNGWLDFKYNVFLTTSNEPSIEVEVNKNGYKVTGNWGDRFGCEYDTLEDVMESVVRYINRANGC